MWIFSLSSIINDVKVTKEGFSEPYEEQLLLLYVIHDRPYWFTVADKKFDVNTPHNHYYTIILTWNSRIKLHPFWMNFGFALQNSPLYQTPHITFCCLLHYGWFISTKFLLHKNFRCAFVPYTGCTYHILFITPTSLYLHSGHFAYIRCTQVRLQMRVEPHDTVFTHTYLNKLYIYLNWT